MKEINWAKWSSIAEIVSSIAVAMSRLKKGRPGPTQPASIATGQPRPTLSVAGALTCACPWMVARRAHRSKAFLGISVNQSSWPSMGATPRGWFTPMLPCRLCCAPMRTSAVSGGPWKNV